MSDFSGTMVAMVAIAQELCFPKHHYESIVPSKPGIIRYMAIFHFIVCKTVNMLIYSWNVFKQYDYPIVSFL